MQKCQQTTIDKLDPVLRMKLLSPLGGITVAAFRNLGK